MSYTLSAHVDRPYDEAVAAVRAALVEQGFGILTEIDLSTTLKAKLGVELPPQVILGACRPALAHEALLADPSIAAVLPCNVVVRSVDARTTVVEVFDPTAMTALAGDALRRVADDARSRLLAMLEAVAADSPGPEGRPALTRSPTAF